MRRPVATDVQEDDPESQAEGLVEHKKEEGPDGAEQGGESHWIKPFRPCFFGGV